MLLKDQIKTDKETVKIAHDICVAAERHFESIERPIKYAHKQILDRFRAIINDKIKEEHHCTRGCDPDYYDSAIFTENGISMRIDASHPNDIIDRDWSWEEIETILSERPLA